MTLPYTIGPYKIQENLGEGRYATVYLATKGSDQVALKVLRPEYAREDNQVARFKQEAETIAQLTHKNIIRILDTDNIDGEYHFLAMEYIAGGSLAGRLKAGALSRHNAVNLTKDISAALTYVHTHEKKIVHRDLKPENILLKDTPEGVQPILTDFGIVKLLSKNDDEPPLTKTGEIFGTYYYMSPEQWDAKPVTPVTDLYALAVIFFEMLAVQRPFQGNYTELMTQHLSKERPRLSEVAPQAGDFFDDIIIRAMAINPTDRYSTVADFFEAIDTANHKVDLLEKLKKEQNERAATILNAAKTWLKPDAKGRDLDMALNTIEKLLETDPGRIEALLLKGEIYFEQEKFAEALETYQAAFELTADLLSEAGLAYLEGLRKVAEHFWERDRYQAVGHYHHIVELLEAHDERNEATWKIWGQAQSQLIIFHLAEGRNIYEQSSDQSLDNSIVLLTYHLEWLDRIKINSEDRKYKELDYDRLQLQVRQYRTLIQAEKNKITTNTTEDMFSSPSRDKCTSIAQSYLNINNYCQKLMGLEPHDQIEWERVQCQNLKTHTLLQRRFAQQAEKAHDFETAIWHYRQIVNHRQQVNAVEQCEKLDVNLEQVIEALEEHADYENKYQTIVNLVFDEDFAGALERLERDFIQNDDFEYRNVARLHWRLLYAKKKGWNVTAQWVVDSAIEIQEQDVQQTTRFLEPGQDVQQITPVSKLIPQILLSSPVLIAIQGAIIIVSILIGVFITTIAFNIFW